MTRSHPERGRTTTIGLVDRALLDGAEPDVSAIADQAGLAADEVAEIVETRRLLFAEGLIGSSSSVDAEAAELEVPASDDPTPPPFARWIEDRIGAAPVGSKRPERVGRWTLDGIGADHPLGRWFPAFESDGVLAADVLVLRARMPSDVVDRVFHAARLARGLDGDTWIGVHETGFEDDLAYIAFEPFGATLADIVNVIATSGGSETPSTAAAAVAVGLATTRVPDAAHRAAASAVALKNPAYVESVCAFGAAWTESLSAAHRRDVLQIDATPTAFGFDRRGHVKIRAPGVFDAAGAIARRASEGLDDRAPEARIVHGVVGIPADAWVIASVVARLFLLDGVPAEAAAPTVRKGLEGRLAHELVDVLVRGLSESAADRPSLDRFAEVFRKAAHPGLLARWFGRG